MDSIFRVKLTETKDFFFKLNLYLMFIIFSNNKLIVIWQIHLNRKPQGVVSILALKHYILNNYSKKDGIINF